MKKSGGGAARAWMHVALAAAASSGLLALVDGWFQPGNAQALLRLPTMAFSVLGAWLLVALALAPAVLLLRRDPPSPAAGLAFGTFAGLAPLLFGLLPGAFESMRIALAHMLSVGVALIVYFQTRPGPALRWTALAAAPPALVLIAALLLPNELPRLRSAPALRDEALLEERGGRPEAPAGAPDLVLISVDTLRADAVVEDPSRPGVPRAPTPFLDALRAQEAAWAHYALSSSDQTLPGHLGMLSGLDAMAHGVRHNFETPAEEIPLLAQILRAAGYRTAATIANGLIGAATGMDRGYDDFSEQPVELALFGLQFAPWLDEHTWIGRCSPRRWNGELFARLFFRRVWARRAQPIGERTLEAALAQRADLTRDAAPAFHFVHFMDPHADYAPPPQWRDRLSADAAAGLPAHYLPAPQAPLHGGLVQAVEDGLASAEAETARRAADYYHLVYLEEVAYVDDCLRRLVEAVRASGRPTVFLITADHGEMFGEHGLMEHANGLWEENLRVPFLIFGANVPPGLLEGVPHLDDVPPTLLTLAGLPLPPEWTGRPVLQPAEGPLPNGERAPLALRHAAPGPREHVGAQAKEVSVRQAQWKWTAEWDEAGTRARAARSVDLAADPFEAAPQPADLAALAEALRDVVTRALGRDTWPTRAKPPVGALQAGIGKDLGYAGD